MPRIFSSEHTHSYKNYSFGYTLYAERLGNESIDNMYSLGFLPYSGDHHISTNNLYYMARSARVNLGLFSPTSENRRIKKKFDELNITFTEHPASDFIENKKMNDFCIKYFEEKHGPGVLSKERLQRILSYSPETKVIEYKNLDGIACAYIIENQGRDLTHYWFSFYDLSLAQQSFGMWLMIDRTREAKENNKKYCYLGTVYGDKALYKTNIPNLEFWNGESWSKDIELLKKRARTDGTRVVSQSDEFKNSEI